MTAAPHNFLWERLLTALGRCNALPADIGNRTPLEIARFADERLRANLAVPFVEGYYLECRYGGTASKLSDADAEALVAQIESAPLLPASQSVPSPSDAASSATRALQTHTLQVLPVAAPNSTVVRPENEESQPIGVEFLPKPKPAPRPTPPSTSPRAPRVEQAVRLAVAARPKPKKLARSDKVRRTFGQSLRDLGRGLFQLGWKLIVGITILAAFAYWNKWRNSTHWKLKTEGDSTVISALSDVTETTEKDSPREKIMIGCENGREFLRFTWMQPMPGSSKPYVYQGIYLRHGLRVPFPEHENMTTLVWQDHLFLQPMQGETSAFDFQAVSATPENEDGRRSESDLQEKDVNVQEFLSRFSQSKELVLDIEGYLDSQGKHYEYGWDSEQTRFPTEGLASQLPQLEQACHWKPSGH
jgi:hypothetical protein